MPRIPSNGWFFAVLRWYCICRAAAPEIIPCKQCCNIFVKLYYFFCGNYETFHIADLNEALKWKLLLEAQVLFTYYVQCIMRIKNTFFAVGIYRLWPSPKNNNVLNSNYIFNITLSTPISVSLSMRLMYGVAKRPPDKAKNVKLYELCATFPCTHGKLQNRNPFDANLSCNMDSTTI